MIRFSKSIWFFLLIYGLSNLNCYRGRPSEKPPVHVIPDMDDQPKYEAQEKNTFFSDNLAMRKPPPGTVAHNQLQDDPEYDFGLGKDGKYIDSVPVDITLALLQRGQERYNIFCAPCHSKVGDGKGVLVTKGYVPPPTFHAERLRDIPDGYIYDVIMNGVRNMPSYKHQIPVNDRWAITAYVRALQLNQNATLDDVPKEMRDQLK